MYFYIIHKKKLKKTRFMPIFFVFMQKLVQFKNKCKLLKPYPSGFPEALDDEVHLLRGEEFRGLAVAGAG